MKPIALLSLFLLTACAFTPHQQCVRDAVAANYAGPGSLIANAIDPPPPHPPLKEMLAACPPRNP